MRRTRRWLWVVMVNLVLLVALLGCDGGNGDGNGGVPDAQTDAARDAALDTLGTTISVALEAMGQFLETQTGTTRTQDAADRRQTQEPFEVMVDCPQSGETSVAGTFSITGTETAGSFTLDVDASYRACDGIDGVLSFDVTASFEGAVVDFVMIFDGMVEDGCAVTVEQLRMDAMVDIGTEEITGTLSGSFDATCDPGTVACTWQNVDIEDEAALEAGCN